MTDQLPDVDQLPEHLSDPMKVLGRGERICAVMDEINGNCGSIRVAGRYVDMQDRIARLESDLAWIRRRTGFWGEVPQT